MYGIFVCKNSSKLENYKEISPLKSFFESNGPRNVCGFCDLGNMSKILADSNNDMEYWRDGGLYGV